MILLRNIGQYLQDNGVGTLATDIFVEKLPANPDNAILIVSIVGPAPDQYLDTAYQDFEIWGRSQSTKTGSDKMSNVFNLLHRNHHLTLGDYYLYFIEAMDSLANLDEDTAGRRLFKQTYRAIYRDTRTVS